MTERNSTELDFLKEELRRARLIQRMFIKESDEVFNDVHINSRYLPALDVGGDFFHLRRINDRLLAVAIGDVCGHGVGAAMLTPMMGQLLSQTLRRFTNPAMFMYHINNAFCDTFQTNEPSDTSPYVCMFYGLIDTARKRLYCVNAGLTPPVYIKAGDDSITELNLTGTPIGFLKDSEYEQRVIPYDLGDALMLYTDGLADNLYKYRSDEFYDRLSSMLMDMYQDSSPKVMTDSLLGVFAQRGGALERFKADDISLIICKFG